MLDIIKWYWPILPVALCIMIMTYFAIDEMINEEEECRRIGGVLIDRKCLYVKEIE